MKIRLLFKRPSNRTDDSFFKLFSFRRAYGMESLFEIYVFRLIPYAFVSAILGYLVLAFALTLWVNRRDFSTISYWDVLKLPTSWDSFEKKRGEDYIRSGKQALEDGRLQEGVMKIRVGLSKNPESLEARMFIARLFYMSGRIHQASYTLEKGIAMGIQDKALLQTYFSICEESDQHDEIIRVCHKIFETGLKDKTEENQLFLETKLIQALLKTEQWEEVLKMAQPINAQADRKVKMVDAEFYALINLKRYDEAEELLKRWNIRTSTDPNLQYLAVELFAHSGDIDQLKTACQRLLNFDLLNPENHIRILEKLHQAGLKEEQTKAIDRFFTFFGDNEKELLLLHHYAAGQKNLPLAERIVKWVRDHQFDDKIHLFNLFYIYLSVGQWDDAKAILDEITPRLEEFNRLDRQLIQIGQYIVELKTDARDAAAPQLLDALHKLRASIPFYLMLKDVLVTCELRTEAVATMNQALGLFPDSARIREAQQEVTRNLREHEAIIEAEENITITLSESPETLLEHLDAFIQSKQFDDAEALLSKIGQAKPTWWNAHRDEFEYRRLMIYMETRDSFLQANSTTLFLEKHPEKTGELLSLARQYTEKGNKAQAQLIVEQILNADSSNTEARQLYREITNTNYKSSTQKSVQIKDLSAYDEQHFAINELRTAIENENWDQAGTTVQNILEANPTWMRNNRESFDLLNLQLRMSKGNFSQAETLIRIFMAGDPYSARTLLKLAQQNRESGKTEIAEFIEEQVHESFPGLEPDEE